MMNFVERVRFLSNMYDYSQTDIANGTGISKNQISKYVSGIDVSIEFLIGRTDEPKRITK